MDFLKTIGGKIVSGVVGIAVLAIGISWWQMDPSTRQMLVSGSGKIIGWLLLVGVVPWVTFFVVGWVGKMESNLAGAMLILFYTAAESILLAWLFNWKIHSPTPIVFFVAATLLAGAYNLFVCDWLAERLES